MKKGLTFDERLALYRAIREDRAKGRTLREIGEKFGYTYVGIWKIVARGNDRKSGPQRQEAYKCRDKEIVAMRKDGKLLRECGARFGITRERARQIVARETGINKGRATGATDVVERARLLWECGFSASDIATDIGTTRNAIIGIAHRNDFPSRPSSIRKRAA